MLEPAPSCESDGVSIAIVGMAGRFPDAPDVETLWRNICQGVESVTCFTNAQLCERGVPAQLLNDPNYVKAAVVLEGMDQFDAGFFGYTPNDARHIDPQQRMFLECAWEALEHAGYDPAGCTWPVGIYAGCGANAYLIRNVLPQYELDSGGDIADVLGLMSGNQADALCTRVAYKLNLRGPAITVQTACSTSLTAVHTACQSLLGFECDMALAGGVSLNLFQNGGYRYQPGAILSPDGHCRAFDAKAAGTLWSSGAGIVVLKRLEDALRDSDTIHAVIRGSAANNDGSDKVGFTAPGISGQVAAIRAAQLVANVNPETIGYIETHGTGTTLGDPIEVAALTQAFRAVTQKRQYCAIGSLKTNIGHMDTAAGVSGLIKVVMALKHKTLPASLHFEQPNPEIDFANSPFFVNTETKLWETARDQPRRAGVSSFGIGGTNVHLIIEEAPEISVGADVDSEGRHILPVSARSDTALQQACLKLAKHLRANSSQRFEDVAYTLQSGRHAFQHRVAVVAGHAEEAAEKLALPDLLLSSGRVAGVPPEVVFVFPGGGSQHLNMGSALYRSSSVFREEIDRCCDILLPELQQDLRRYILAKEGEKAAASDLSRMSIAQPALFIVNYALARVWISLGVEPAVMLGHSLGEYVAACLAEVFTLEDALQIIAARGRLMETLPAGAMTAVTMSEADLRPLIKGCDLAAINGEQLCVIAGPTSDVEAVEKILYDRQQLPRRLHVAVASHSSMMEPIMAELEAVISARPRQAPTRPFLSNVTGKLITAQQATDPVYWSQHLRGTVRFADSLKEALNVKGRVVLEVGPGDALSSLVRQHPNAGSAAGIWSSQTHAQQHKYNASHFAKTMAGLWNVGISIDWDVHRESRTFQRVPLPTYPFQRQRYWIETNRSSLTSGISQQLERTHFYMPSWRSTQWITRNDSGTDCVVVYGNDEPCSQHLVSSLRNNGLTVIQIVSGEQYTKINQYNYQVRSADREQHEEVVSSIRRDWGAVTLIYYLWALDNTSNGTVDTCDIIERSFFSLMALGQAWGGQCKPGDQSICLATIVNQSENVSGGEPLSPEKSTLRGLIKVISQEYPAISCRIIDVVLPQPDVVDSLPWINGVLSEHCAPQDETIVAYRGWQRWVKTYEPVLLNLSKTPRLRQQGVYLISGGLGGVGLALAKHLAEKWQARLVLLGRTVLPERACWAQLIADREQPEHLRQKLKQLLQLETVGGEFLALFADVSEQHQLEQAIRVAQQQFGQLHGVIHAAGSPGKGMLVDKCREQAQQVLAPKVRGTQLLKQALADCPLDFVVLCSSIASVAGGLGMSDYAAANAYLDAAADHWQRSVNYPVISIGWDAWRNLGMAEGITIPDGIGMDGPEGAQACEAIINSVDASQVINCTTDLNARLNSFEGDALSMLEYQKAPVIAHKFPRPQLQTPYVKPDNDLTKSLEIIWCDALGICPVGLDDNLFELGGDSLLAIQLLGKVKKHYGVAMHPAEFFKAPTIRDLAFLVESALIDEILGAEPTDSAETPVPVNT